MTVYFRSKDLVITDQVIRFRIVKGWQICVIAGLSDFGIVRHHPPADRRSWGLGWSALPVTFLASRLGGWLLVVAALTLVVACAWFVADCRLARRRASAQLWARRQGSAVLLFELPSRDFEAACRALRRVLERQEDERHDR
jgi:hypothetical protein